MVELHVLDSKTARLILDLSLCASTSDALGRLHWKPLQRRRAEHPAIFTPRGDSAYERGGDARRLA